MSLNCFQYTRCISLEHVELFGKQYIIDHCVTEYNNAQRQEAYEIYVSESLRAIAENTAALAGGGRYMKAGFMDIIKPKKQDKRTGEEIAADVIKKAGLKVVK